MNEKSGCKLRLGAATLSDISYLSVQENLIFIRGKSGNFDKWFMWQSWFDCGGSANPSYMYALASSNVDWTFLSGEAQVLFYLLLWRDEQYKF